MSLAVEFRKVSKHYRGVQTYRALRDDMMSAARRVLGLRRSQHSVVRALETVDLEVPVGTSMAIMGANGSGKTTALKLISRLTYPTLGSVTIRGRVGALIEVGTGLHPELTGRENTELYGRILGLSGRDIRRRFDSIVDFADIGPAIDQPVKQYSTGMQLRLGFSLASHLEPEILVVDEALSVGDAGFQQRCIERMNELRKSGITLLFVSHVPSLMAALCPTGILLDRGRIVASGPTTDVIDAYLALVTGDRRIESGGNYSVGLDGWDWELTSAATRGLGDLSIRVNLDATTAIHNPKFGIHLAEGSRNLISCSMLIDDFEVGTISGKVTLSCVMRDLPLEPGPYAIHLSGMEEAGVSLLFEPRLLGYALLQSSSFSKAALTAGTAGFGPVRVPYEWRVESATGASQAPAAP